MIIHQSVSGTLMLKYASGHLQELRTDVSVAVEALLELQESEIQRAQELGVGQVERASSNFGMGPLDPDGSRSFGSGHIARASWC